MIGTLRKHQAWLWYFIIAVIIVTFVGYFNPSTMRSTGGGRQSSSGQDVGSINGEPITIDQFQAARREAQLFFFLHYKKWPERVDDMEKAGFDQDNWAYERLVVDAAMKQMKIQVPDQAAARTTKELFGLKADEALPPDEFNKFVQNELMKHGITVDDFDNFIRHQTGLEHLISLYGMSGRMITIKEAEFFYRRENEPMDTELVTFQISNYFSKITITPKELEDFYAKYATRYSIPERSQLNYIRYDLTNFYSEADKKIAAITNYSQAIDRTYLEKGPANYKDDKGTVLTADAAKAKIKKEHRDFLAREAAGEQARKVILSLYEGHDENYQFTTNDLFNVAKKAGVSVKTTEPFDERTGPKELGLAKQANTVLFNLTDKGSSDQFYPVGPLASEEAVYVVGFNHRFPNQAQSLSAVREKVYADFRMQKAYDMVKMDAENFDAAAQIGLAKGENFDAIAAAQHLKPKVLSHYAITSKGIPEVPDRGDFESLQSSTFNLPTGKCSQFIPTEEGGMIAYVRSRLPVDAAMMARELPAYLSRMRDQRQVAAFQEWFQRQSAEMHVVRAITPKSKTTGS